ncbi:hypothetical protein [Marinobacter sp.]|uniref:hypothetical protein n=1 Tax=Marinobacter sp. TaxID=50741 RepID=UPI00257A8D8F|nr:hypothetical protein [Marinobacter sp.]
MSEHNHDQIAQEAADRAVAKVFAMLGVDIKNPRQIEDFRMDLRLARYMRQWLEKGVMATAGILFVGLCAAVFVGIQTKLGVGK